MQFVDLPVVLCIVHDSICRQHSYSFYKLHIGYSRHIRIKRNDTVEGIQQSTLNL